MMHEQTQCLVYKSRHVHAGGELLVRDTGQEFTEAYPHTHALALLYGGTLLMARGCLKPQEPTLSAALGFWNVRPGARVVEKVRDAPVATPHGGGVAAWAWHEHDHHFTVALAYADIHCSVQLLTFKRTELRPSKPTVATLAVAKDSNGDASITNMHLLPAEGNPADLRLFLTLARKGGSGRIESRGTDARQPGGAAVTALEASAVAEGRTAEFAEGEVVVVTGAGQGAPLQSAPPRLLRACSPRCMSFPRSLRDRMRSSARVPARRVWRQARRARRLQQSAQHVHGGVARDMPTVPARGDGRRRTRRHAHARAARRHAPRRRVRRRRRPQKPPGALQPRCG